MLLLGWNPPRPFDHLFSIDFWNIPAARDHSNISFKLKLMFEPNAIVAYEWNRRLEGTGRLKGITIKSAER